MSIDPSPFTTPVGTRMAHTKKWGFVDLLKSRAKWHSRARWYAQQLNGKRTTYTYPSENTLVEALANPIEWNEL